MRRTYASVALSAGVALALTFSAAGRAKPSAPRDPARGTAAAVASLPAEQVRLADVTLKLEKAFDNQFRRGAIDQIALSGAIDDVLDAMPEAARPRVQVHIAEVLRAGERLVSEMTPAERAQATASPALELLDKTRQAQITAWGWPGAAGWGGLGAFGFPLMYGWGAGYR